MAEYVLVCDTCGESIGPQEAVVSWRADPAVRREDGFALTHGGCVPPAASARREARMLVSPNGYLDFFGDRFARLAEGWEIGDAGALRSLLHALAPFVMRHDSPAETEAWRAASFGATLGVKPGEVERSSKPAKEIEAGK